MIASIYFAQLICTALFLIHKHSFPENLQILTHIAIQTENKLKNQM